MRFLAALLLLTSTVTGSSIPNSIVEGWKTSPVYVDPTQRALVPDEEAAKLAERVRDHRPDIRIAVVPTEALDDGRRDKQMSAEAFVETVAYKHGSEGIYLVVFGDRMTWGSAVGVNDSIGPILSDQRAKHARSDAVGLLNGVLDELNVPEAPSGFPGWLLAFLIVVAVLLVGGVAFWWWQSRRQLDGRAAPDESEPEQLGTLEEQRAAVQEDVTRFGAELDAANLPPERLGETSDADADVQAAKAAYATAGRVLEGEPDQEQLQGVRATVGYGRWRLACAQARLAGQPVPAWRGLGAPAKPRRSSDSA
ncbi:hypothetical protein [Kribbella sp. CA-247076]|uniref:hypothetical protein n=1 Tax=Kribbella sp. CA-247076 TaxID=3239941 RepID=UPI003D8A039B